MLYFICVTQLIIIGININSIAKLTVDEPVHMLIPLLCSARVLQCALLSQRCNLNPDWILTFAPKSPIDCETRANILRQHAERIIYVCPCPRTYVARKEPLNRSFSNIYTRTHKHKHQTTRDTHNDTLMMIVYTIAYMLYKYTSWFHIIFYGTTSRRIIIIIESKHTFGQCGTCSHIIRALPGCVRMFTYGMRTRITTHSSAHVHLYIYIHMYSHDEALMGCTRSAEGVIDNTFVRGRD